MAELLRLGRLSNDEEVSFNRNLNLIDKHLSSNATAQAYYEGRQRVLNLRIAVPPELEAKLMTAVGWAGTAVDVLEERLDFLGWVATQGDYHLDEVYQANDLDAEASKAHLDSLMFGTGFIAVGSGDVTELEPHPLVSVLSPRTTAGVRDVRTRRLRSAVTRFWDDELEDFTSARLYVPGQTIYLWRGESGQEPWQVYYRDEHHMDRLPVVQMPNRPTASRPYGRSEITRAVRGITDNAVRTIMAMEMNREFNWAPRLWATDVSEEQFTRADGSTVTGWEAVIGRMLAVRHDEDNPEAQPKVGQFDQGKPAPYLEYLQGLAQLLSAECAIPPMYLGFATDQAASADAIRAMEVRLLKRAERRQLTFGKAWLEVARLALLVRDGAIPKTFDTDVYLDWRDAATPTRSAAAAEAVSLVQAQILPPDSAVTYKRIGLTAMEQKQVEQDRRRMVAVQMMQTAREQANASRQADPGLSAKADSNKPMQAAA
ncbi:phage portal protein [Nocardia transvalensis]|uniref:phage portal protein n=1 Tax=Nocardia transvalensis TaxID=37333 RepID=UPI0018933456|nr:phage portal protein [Nocardia transvalensis]MBF6330854.1 phage portal protein [Nocardia transvalensis]